MPTPIRWKQDRARPRRKQDPRPLTIIKSALGEMARVARLGIVINDLDRSRLGWVGAWLIGHVLTRNRLTRHDAPMSVRRAYRPSETAGLLREAGLIPVRTVHSRLGLRYAIAALIMPDGGPAIHEDPLDPRGVGDL